MSGRVIDKAATKAARARQARGIDRLNSIFGFVYQPTEPTPRIDRARKRTRRKIAHESRRRNRA